MTDYQQRSWGHPEVPSEVFGQLRAALINNHHEQYLSIANDSGLRCCELCHLLLTAPVARLCDGCWEIHNRIDILQYWGATTEGRTALETFRKTIDKTLAKKA